MAVGERLRRKAPVREAPNRKLKSSAEPSSKAGGPAAPSEPASPWPAIGDPAVESAVRTAYRVAADNIEEGRRTAERLRAAMRDPEEPPPTARAMAGRVAHITRDLGAAWVELVMAVLKDPELRSLFDRSTAREVPVSPPGPGRAPGPSSAVVVTTVRSMRPVEINLSPLPGGSHPAIAGVFSLDPAAPPIGKVRFARRDDGSLALNLDVADDQPPGVYAGVVVDAPAGQPIGTLTLRVLD